jgi:hypothetical protein
MKTAVEWLEEMLTISLGEHHMSLFINEFNKAKKMEKEQMVKHSVELTKILISNPFETSGKTPRELVDNYFNETFKQQEQ